MSNITEKELNFIDGYMSGAPDIIRNIYTKLINERHNSIQGARSIKEYQDFLSQGIKEYMKESELSARTRNVIDYLSRCDDELLKELFGMYGVRLPMVSLGDLVDSVIKISRYNRPVILLSPNFGRKSYRELREHLLNVGLIND